MRGSIREIQTMMTICNWVIFLLIYDQEVTDNPKGTDDSDTVVPADKTDGESDPDTPETSNESQTNTEPAPETEIQSTSDADTAEPESGDADTLNTEADIWFCAANESREV